jgi:hypothetical protein
MLTRHADLPRLARRAAVVLMPVLMPALLLLAAPLAATPAPQPAAPAAPAATAATPAVPVTAADRAALRRDIERLYEVLPTHDGVLLRPRSQRLGVRTIELAGDDMSVNGNRLSAAVLREWLGTAQADPVIRLSQVDPASRRALFDIKSEAQGAAGSPPLAAVPAPPVPVAPAAPPALGSPPAPASGVQGSESDDGEEVQGSAAADETANDAADDETPKPGARSRRAGSGDIVRFAGSVTVRPGENPQEVTAIAGSVTVDGEVSGDVVAVGGSCTINGRVGGSVTAVGGSVRLGPQAEVMGDISSVGGIIDRAPGARVHGSVSEVSALGAVGHRDGYGTPWAFLPFAGVGLLIETITKILLLALLVCLVLLVARPTVERIALRVGAEPGRAGLTGVLSQLAFLPLLVVVTVLLAITVIGCALYLLYPFAFIALLLAGLVGYAAVALRLGGWAEARFGWRYTSPYMMAIAGVALIEFLPFLGRMLGLIGLLAPLTIAARGFGFLIEYLAWTIGFGAVVLDFLAAGGFRQWRRPGTAVVVPAPSTIPPPAPPPPAAPVTPADPWETR